METKGKAAAKLNRDSEPPLSGGQTKTRSIVPFLKIEILAFCPKLG
jgi:hypothetical protein